MHWLQAVVDWIFSRRSSLVQLSLYAPNTDGASRHRPRGRGPEPPTRPPNPDNWVRAPKGDAPTGRSSSVAVAEPVDDEIVIAVGRPHRDRALVI